MKFLFIIQGEGRGHMTQAISCFELLQELGHEISAVCIGKSRMREIPGFVKEKLHSPIHLIESPGFVFDKKHKGIVLRKTISENIGKFGIYKDSLIKINDLVLKYRPDIILNFYDILGGLYNAIYKPDCQFWVIGHQYLSLHPDFTFAKGRFLDKTLFQINTKLTALWADRYLALSFKNLPNGRNKKLLVLPPLLRRELLLMKPKYHDFFLTYMVNPGYAEDVLHYAKKNPNLKIEAFWDKKGAPECYRPLPNVIFHKINDSLFLEKMSQCRGLVSTAGFESICEAMFLGKPVMMIPVSGHYEQACNAEDAFNAKGGIIADNFDFGFFHKHLSKNIYSPEPMKFWQGEFRRKFLSLLDENYHYQKCQNSTFSENLQN